MKTRAADTASRYGKDGDRAPRLCPRFAARAAAAALAAFFELGALLRGQERGHLAHAFGAQDGRIRMRLGGGVGEVAGARAVEVRRQRERAQLLLGLAGDFHAITHRGRLLLEDLLHLLALLLREVKAAQPMHAATAHLGARAIGMGLDGRHSQGEAAGGEKGCEVGVEASNHGFLRCVLTCDAVWPAPP